MAFYTYDHIHLLSPEPLETAPVLQQDVRRPYC